MSVLRPITDTEFSAWLSQAVPAYADDKVESGAWPQEHALERSRQEHAALLAQGKDTPDHFVYSIVGDAGSPVGAIWFAAEAQGPTRVAYVYNVVVWPEHRRRGHATHAFAALGGRGQAPGPRRHCAARLRPQPGRAGAVCQAGLQAHEFQSLQTRRGRRTQPHLSSTPYSHRAGTGGLPQVQSDQTCQSPTMTWPQISRFTAASVNTRDRLTAAWPATGRRACRSAHTGAGTWRPGRRCRRSSTPIVQ